MQVRLIEILLAGSGVELFEDLFKEVPVIDLWHQEISDTQSLVKVTVPKGETERVLDILETYFGGKGEYRALILPVEATVPRPEEPEPVPEEAPENREKAKKGKSSRISREELYTNIVETGQFSRMFVVMTVLSTIVAAIGLVKDSVAIIIGAMVIAPLLGPNMALALGTTLGDTDLVRRSLKASLAGISVALALSFTWGVVFTVDPGLSEITERTSVDLSDIVLALASGCAGALAFTTGVSTSLIGVMVAVALLPPLTVLGLMLGAGEFRPALGAGLLLLTNVICVNLAAVITFLAQKIQPRTWWEADKARKATRVAVTLWSILLVLLAAALYVSQTL